MLSFRPFHNSDPPRLVEIWNAQPRQRGLAHALTVPQLEDGVLSKCYFDRDGLIVAEDEGRVEGFVHCGFGPTEDGCQLDREFGVTSMLMVRPELETSSLGAELLAQGEAYLRGRGAKVLYGGGIRPLNPFYLGFYGGSELPGILQSDRWRQELFAAHGYRTIDTVIVLHCDLGQFRPPVNRQQLLLRRSTQVVHRFDAATSRWFDAYTLGVLEPVRFELVDKISPGRPLGSASFWTMEPLASGWNLRAAGLIDLIVDPGQQRRGLATCLLSECFRQIQLQGFAMVEAQAMQNNVAGLGLYRKLGFTEVDRGSVLRKES